MESWLPQRKMKGQIRVSFTTETASQVGRFHSNQRVPLVVEFQRRTTMFLWWLMVAVGDGESAWDVWNGFGRKKGEEIDVSSIEACRPRIFFINGFLCFLVDEWQRNEERKRERRCHFKEKMSLEEAHHHRRPWIRAWRKKEMNEERGREEHGILCSKWALKSEV